MKTWKFFSKIIIVSLAVIAMDSCGNNLYDNPNASSTATPTLVLNYLTSKMVLSEEMPFSTSSPAADKVDQYWVSNYTYYMGNNSYNWSNSAERYTDVYKYAAKLEDETTRQYGSGDNIYFAIAKFYKAYAAIWLSERVGDIPLSQAGSTTNLTPAYDTQKQVYAEAITLLEAANTMMNNLYPSTNSSRNTVFSSTGDIFGLTPLQWQKVINTFELRVLISMSKRADDNTAGIDVKSKFATIVNNPNTYPIITSNSDNMLYKFNTTYNPYPLYSNRTYTMYANISKTLLDLTTANQDPRTFIFATPAPAQYITAGKSVSDFTAYVGVSNNLTQAAIMGGTDASSTASTDKGAYSYINYKRYFSSADGSTCEPYVVIGYPELCFNIAEALARGWFTGTTTPTGGNGTNASAWYTAGIKASLNFYGLTDGSSITISDRLGGSLGTVTVSYSTFQNNANVAYKGDNASGIQQIVEQKYVAMFCNSGYEGFYNWLRTGYPSTFQQGGAGIGTANNAIPHRWMYPTNEITYNSANYQAAITSQYGGTDDITQYTWLFK